MINLGLLAVPGEIVKDPDPPLRKKKPDPDPTVKEKPEPQPWLKSVLPEPHFFYSGTRHFTN